MRLHLNLLALIGVFCTLCYSPVTPASLFSTFASNVGRRQEEISYTVVRSGSGYEERLYPSKNWLCTEQKGGYSDGDQVNVFLRLFDYLGGDNDQKRTLKMGIPASIEYKTDDDGKKTYTACFFIEEKDQDDYPTPTNPEVRILQRPQMTVYSKKFGGYANSESTWLEEAESLKATLKRNGIETRSNLMYWNAYSSPFKFWFRRNEVWLLEE